MGRVAADVVGLFFARNVHRALNEILAENDDLPPSHIFYSYLHTTYANTQTIAVRRNLDERDEDHVSLARVMKEIEAEPKRLTRQRFLETHVFGFTERTEDDWYRNFAGETEDYLDPTIVATDRDALRAATKSHKLWANLRVANTDRRRIEPEERATFAELDHAIDVIGLLFRKYDLLLRGAESPVILHWDPKPDLVALFSVPWIRS
jgi:hypothetical protein